ncbi:MAG: DUF4870 domain-containing protein [Actinomycetota bacterium]|nr:DUF4870 domain-containing protein [Actinomycetota bacterium]
MEEEKKESSSGTGLDPKLAGLLCYAFGWISGIIFYLITPKDEYIRFHAMQSILVFGFLSVLGFVTNMFWYIGWGISSLISLIGLVLWVVLMVKAYQGEKYKLPFFGDLAEKYI